MELWIVWLIVATLLLVVELITGFIAALCLAVGALVASVCGIFGFGIEVQLIALVVGVILAFIFLAPFVNRLRKRRSGAQDNRGRTAMSSDMALKLKSWATTVLF